MEYNVLTMRFGAGMLVVAVAMGCGDVPPAADLDAGPPADARLPCAVLTGENCDPGEKCTWIHESQDVWTVDCFTDGTEELGMPCQWGADGVWTGADNCASGLLCVDNTCRQVCALAVDGCAAPASCVSVPQSMAEPSEFGVCLAP